MDSADSLMPSGATPAEFAASLEADPDLARDMRRATDLKARAALAYMSDNAPVVVEALIESAKAGHIMAIKLVLEVLGIKPLRYKAPAKVDDDMEALGGDGSTGEDFDRIIQDAAATKPLRKGGP